jgi:hypothetical protein
MPTSKAIFGRAGFESRAGHSNDLQKRPRRLALRGPDVEIWFTFPTVVGKEGITS